MPRTLLVLYCLAIWLPGVLMVPATDRDESRFAQASKQMLETGDFVDIRNGTEARNRKPIGIYWLQLPGAALTRSLGIAHDNPIWPYRLPSLFGALTAVLATFAIGRRIAGVPAGLIAATMLGGSVLLAVEANIAKTDAALLAATTLAMGAMARAYLQETVRTRTAVLFWLALGAAILIKGPVAPMVAGLTAASLAIADRRIRWLGALRPAWGVPLMLAAVVPWFVAIGIATGGQFFHDAVGGDLAGKLTGGDDAHGFPPLYHVLMLSVTLFPSGALVLCALPSAWRGRRDRATRFLLAWLIPSWAVFEAVPTKLPHYTLPLFPALCLIAAGWMTSHVRNAPPRWLATTARLLSVAAALVLGIGAACLPSVVGPSAIAGYWSWRMTLGAPALVASLLLARLVWASRGHVRNAAVVLAAAPLLMWSILGLELPHLPRLWPAMQVRDALSTMSILPTSLAAVGYAEPSLMFVDGTATRLLPDGAAGARFMAAAPGRVVIVEERAEAAFLTANPADSVFPFAKIDGFNYSNGRHIRLTLYGERTAKAR